MWGVLADSTYSSLKLLSFNRRNLKETYFYIGVDFFKLNIRLYFPLSMYWSVITAWYLRNLPISVRGLLYLHCPVQCYTN